MKFSTPQATIEQLSDILNMTADIATHLGFPETGLQKAQVIVEELFVNVVSHAYGPESGPVEVTVSVEAGLLRICFRDRGSPFNPLEKETPDLKKRFAQGVPGGAGILLVCGLADTVEYSRDNGCNVLEITILSG